MTKSALFLASMIAYSTTSLYAQRSEISVFKNGNAFYVKKIDVSAEDAKASLTEIPQPTFGTFWLSAENNTIKNVVVKDEKQPTERKVTQMIELLTANSNKKATITLQQDNLKVEGTIIEASTHLLIFQTNTGKWLSLNPNEVKSIEFNEKPSTQLKEETQKQVLEINFAKKAKEQNVQMMYLQDGFNWLPSYHLELINDTQAKLSLRATLINDAEDIENANMNLVVGVPNFAYSYLYSPLVSREPLSTFLSSLNANSNAYYGYNRQSRSRADNLVSQSIISQSFSNNVYYNEAEETIQEETEIMKAEGEKAGDLYFYQLQNISLKKGERALHDIMQANMTYQHIFEAELPKGNADALVEHYITFKNESKNPLTTGTIMLSQHTKPISQDKINYTPIGAKARIKLSTVSDISIKHTEKEIERKDNIKLKNGNHYSLITVEAKAEIKSFKTEDFELCVTKVISGETLLSNVDWKKEKMVVTHHSINPQTKTEWKLKLKPNETQEIVYTYQFYVIRN